MSIDINSGRSTREHGIEQTAVATNLEAAREIARQLRLRDMAGLVVIDFIDMEMNSNIRKVEKAMKEALKDDRARIQVGRISGFGLMEMSRQRLRTGVLEASTRECPHCEGTGLVRTASSAGLSALRMLEEEAARGRGDCITLRASQEAAFYVLNIKRRELDEIEERYGVRILILPDGEVEGARMSVEASGPRPERVVTYAPMIEDDDDLDIPEDEDDIEETEEPVEREPRAERSERTEQGEEREGGRRRRRRRRGRRGPREDGQAEEGLGEEGAAGEGRESEAEGDFAEEEDGAETTVEADADTQPEAGEGDQGETGEGRRRGRRGRRGGRRRREGGEAGTAETGASVEGEALADAVAADDAEPAPAVEAEEAAPVEDAPKTRRRPRARKGKDGAEVAAVETPVKVVAEAAIAEEAPAEEPVIDAAKPKRSRKKKADVVAEEAPAPEAEAAPAVADATEEPAPKAKRSRKKKADVLAEDAAALEAAPAADNVPMLENAAADTAAAPAEEENDGTPRRGWWQRTFGQ